MKKIFLFLICLNLYLILFVGCSSTLPFIKKTTVFAQVPESFYSYDYIEEVL